MKVLFRKLSKTKLSTRLVYFFVLNIFIVSYIFLFRCFFILTGIETVIRYSILGFLGILLLMYMIGDLALLISKRNKTVIFTSFIVLLISACSIVGSLAINKVYGMLQNMNKNTVIYTTDLITLKDTIFTNDKSFKVGIISNDEDTDYILAKEIISKNNLNITLLEYDNNFELLESLYNKEVSGIFLADDYEVMYSGYEAYEKIDEEVKVEFTISKEMENKDKVESTGSVDHPFTVLIMGVDSTKDNIKQATSFNGDTLMLLSFNPKTLNATIFSIPRDTYVPIACTNYSAKINSSSAYGTQCVIKTIQNLTGINIDYYVKINFRGVVDLVNKLNGIDITVPEGVNFCEQNEYRSKKEEDLICIKEGYQHMNGSQALAFARHRKTLPTGDFQRVQHQQLIVEAIANSAKKLNSINDFYGVLDAISRNIETNMSTDDMMGLYGTFKTMISNSNNGSMINIQKTYLSGYDLTMIVKNLKNPVYTFQYYQSSLNAITDAIKVNLDQKKPTLVKTFSFSANETYKVKTIGSGSYNETRKEVIPDFTKKTVSWAEDWCKKRNIQLNYTYVNGDADGTILSQSERYGLLTTEITSITLEVVKKQVVPLTPVTDTNSTTPNNELPTAIEN